jgi:hypothetical protein
MADITNLELTDTFNVLLTRINEIVSKVNDVNVDEDTLTIKLATDSSTEPHTSEIATNTGTLYLSNTGQLKLKYKIGEALVSEVTISGSGAGAISAISLGDSSVTVTDTGTDGNIALQTDGTVRWNVHSNGNILPTTDNAYDIGSADYKIRDMYVSESSLWVGDDHKVDVEGGKMKFRKRKKDKVPKKILDGHGSKNATQHEADAKTHSGKGTLETITIGEWKAYANSLGGSLAATDIRDIWPNDVAYKDDYDEISSPSQPGQDKLPPVPGGTLANVDLKLGNTVTILNPAGDIDVAVHGALTGNPEGAYFEAIIHVMQDSTVRTLNLSVVTIDGSSLNALALANTPNLQANKLSTFKINAVFISGEWKATIVGYPE